MQIIVIGGVYKHFKGDFYRVTDIARDSEDCRKQYVIYEQLNPSDFPAGQRWVRPLEEFNDKVFSGEERFRFIKRADEYEGSI